MKSGTTSASKRTDEAFRWYVGMMSGTSFDAVDVALLLTDGVHIREHGPAHSFGLTPWLRRRLTDHLGCVEVPTELSDEVTRAHADAALRFLAKYRSGRDVAAVGFHGQTILHRPEQGLTVQLGDGAAVARTLQIPVVAGFRLRDVAAGGQGAPIAPIYHEAVLRGGTLPAVQVNIGGVANVTWSDGNRLIAFDCGPGNARIDDLMGRAGFVMDVDGKHGAAGTADERIVAQALADPFFSRHPPKSLDRGDPPCPNVAHLCLDDAAATLAAITAEAIAAAASWFPSPPTRWVIGGGGRHNRAIMRRLETCLGSSVISAEQDGQDGDAVEAFMIAFLAARHFANLPFTFPETTGVDEPCTGGEAFLPRGRTTLSPQQLGARSSTTA